MRGTEPGTAGWLLGLQTGQGGIGVPEKQAVTQGRPTLEQSCGRRQGCMPAERYLDRGGEPPQPEAGAPLKIISLLKALQKGRLAEVHFSSDPLPDRIFKWQGRAWQQAHRSRVAAKRCSCEGVYLQQATWYYAVMKKAHEPFFHREYSLLLYLYLNVLSWRCRQHLLLGHFLLGGHCWAGATCNLLGCQNLHQLEQSIRGAVHCTECNRLGLTWYNTRWLEVVQ